MVLKTINQFNKMKNKKSFIEKINIYVKLIDTVAKYLNLKINKKNDQVNSDTLKRLNELNFLDFKSRNIYGLINKSTLIISGFSTTVVLEAYGFQKKIMYYNFTKKDIYHSIFDSSIVSTNSDYSSFSKELDELLKISQTQYIENHMSNMKYYMSFPKDMEYKDYVLSKIDEIIKN